ncbi:hypothetical protein [Pandoraea sputorum]|uniref:hypothetical protein n=1 Tax=Pandoraea sputorum TaxID=93222 RepID=UPI002B28F2F6|nr:hypothetical protein THI4931_47050 [Pandoraea sputorum]
MANAKISVHFDGPIADNHAVQLRVFSKTLINIQTAIERAYLDTKYGEIWKNARLRDEDYGPTEFLMNQTREGGFIADLIGSQKNDSENIVKRINDAVLPAYEKSKNYVAEDHEKLIDIAEIRRKNYNAGAQIPTSYEDFLEHPDAKQTRAYGDRSIAKEFDQIASTIRAREGDGSSVEIVLYAGKTLSTLMFDDQVSSVFHNVVATRTLGDPVEIPVTLRALDSGKGGISKAKAMNLVSQKEFNLHIHTIRGFSGLKKFLRKRNPPPFRIVACPVLEYGAFDPQAGDMYFMSIIDEQ